MRSHWIPALPLVRSFWILPLLISWSVAAVEVRLSPEERIAPFAAQQLNVQAVRGSGHLLAAWLDRGTLDVSFDGVVQAAARIDADLHHASPAAAAGTNTFLVAWAEPPRSQLLQNVRARRFGADGSILDAAPLDLCRGAAWSPGLLFDGSDYIVMCAEIAEGPVPSLRIVRISESGAITDEVRPNSAWLEEVRPLRAADRLVFAGARYGFIGGMTISIHGLPDTFGSVGGPFYLQSQSWAVAAGPDRVLVVMFPRDSQRFRLVQTSLAPIMIRAPYRPAQLDDVASAAGAILWNGGEYVLAWLEWAGSDTRIRGLRLDRNGDPIDAAPFEISAAGWVAPSLSLTETGVLIAYGRKEGEEIHAYMRTLARLPSPPPRRWSVRH